ncbi:MAG: cytochrome C oxidase subunit IV family protein [bacterium]
MLTIARTAATPVWALLMLATGLSWSVGAVDARATLVVMTLAFIKTGFVASYFMEILHAPLVLRLVFLAWCTGGWAAVIGIYAWG